MRTNTFPQAVKRRQTLLEELAEIDAALTDGRATAEQESRGQQLVALAEAAPQLLRAVIGALYALDGNIDGYGPSKATAMRMCRAAIKAATGRALTP